MCVGDIHNIAERVKDFDPHYELMLDPYEGKYKVVEHRTRKMEEGMLNGIPLFSFQDVCEEVMTIDYIDAEKEPPDIRIVEALYVKDMWRYPGGPEQYYDDMMAWEEKTVQKRDENFNDMVEYEAKQMHKYIMREIDGAPTLKTLY
jgi:hypothetical protein